jgi:hypothetical protein
MLTLFLRMLSHGLQAFLPLAFCAAWFLGREDDDRAEAIRRGVIVALLTTPIAAFLFGGNTHQAEWEAPLAAAAALLVGWVIAHRASVSRTTLVVGSAFIVVRQTMIVGAVLWAAAINAQSSQAVVQVLVAAVTAFAAAGLWILLARGLTPRARGNATAVFAVMCLVQAALYAFHRFAEARMLPWGEVLDAATEPYGPDGIYGAYISLLTFFIPAATGVLTDFLNRARKPFALSGAAVGLAGILATAVAGRATPMPVNEASAPRNVPVAAAAAPSAGLTEMVAVPHLLFRGSRMDANYGKMSITALDAPGQQRIATSLGCDRVSFGESGGICLRAERGIRTSFTAVLFDSAFQATKSIPLDGQPSRTRVSPDGRVGAFTVFVTGLAHGYASNSFSTKTTLVDMSTGDVIGDLEDFTTWRDGQRFKAADFNFWGVTFGRNSNLFYATLQTAGHTYLVRGDLALRKLTVLRDGVECPSLSPDNTLIAFKKRVGPALAPWRIYVLDLATMADRPVAAETRSVDDQMEWLDSSHILYGMERSSAVAIRDVWVAPIDGADAARVFLPEAESPIVIRQQ